jgi:hypothetical protein
MADEQGHDVGTGPFLVAEEFIGDMGEAALVSVCDLGVVPGGQSLVQSSNELCRRTC